MQKVIGFVYLYTDLLDESNLKDESKGGLGGSETWLIQLSATFAKNPNYHVIVFCHCETWHFSEDNVEFVPLYLLESRCKYQHFDCMIIGRLFANYQININNIIKETQCCNNVYALAQDLYFWKREEQINYIKDNDEINYIKKFFALTEFHKNFLIEYSNFPEDKIIIAPDGIDLNLFNDIDIFNTERDHSLLWSSIYHRNFNVLGDKLYPLIKKEIPDFKIYTCQYWENLPEKYQDNKDIISLGSLSKKELYKERVKHPVFFYSNHVAETFCITILEAAICGNDIVVPNLYGPGDILSPYSDFLLPNDPNYFNSEENCQIAANMVIDSILNYNEPHKIKLRNSIRNYVIKNYNWDIIAKNMEKEMNI